MADDNDQTASGDAPAGDPAAATDADPTAALIEGYRKRQAGADARAAAAERERDDLRRQLEAAATRKSDSGDGAPAVDVAAIKRELQADFQKKLDEGLATARQATLQRLYPVASAKFPGLTDEGQLAELEAVFGDAATEPAKPIGNNQARQPAGGKALEDMTSEELQAQIRNMPRDAFGLR